MLVPFHICIDLLILLVDVLTEVLQLLGLRDSSGLVMLHPVEVDSPGEVFVDPQVDVLPVPDVDSHKIVHSRHHLGLVVGRPHLLGLGTELGHHGVLDAVHQGLDIIVSRFLITGASGHHCFF